MAIGLMIRDSKDKRFCEAYWRLLFRHVTHFNRSNLHYACHRLHEEVEHRYKGHGLVIVGGFLFLRMLCPALITAQQHSEKQIGRESV